MNTLMMLFCQYDGKPLIPVADVASDYFGIDKNVFLRKVTDGSIDLPLVRMENSQKGFKGVHVKDLAIYIDDRHANAQREHQRMLH
ncbi:Pyocin activator protein PrtN [Loktanella sp. D2R18]|uniref:pyocin activator PrtN family protein n=1 Tax=Rhodobacterales TaxID=204455 RepID=UPI000DE84BBF|nr:MULTISPECIES: pyocin activator PrtN family protein [Rhodobacterales]MDO6591843.1 pyocin activator PrtN family protein [Yoonia sp. 1_MG-2023]RBW44859.1 Pyocin activator protein PrtN [Loktanella sp. D2R18]